MITVRFPSGQAVQYNDADTIHTPTSTKEYFDLVTERKNWVARVPASCIIEFRTPCRAYNPLAERKEVDEKVAKELKALRATIRKLERMVIK